jgi:Ribonuclease G/E
MTTREVCTRVVVDPCPRCKGTGLVPWPSVRKDVNMIEKANVVCLQCKGEGWHYTEEWVTIEALREELDVLFKP